MRSRAPGDSTPSCWRTARGAIARCRWRAPTRILGRGLVYQNPFIIWFNHAGEKAYAGPRFELQDDVIVVGGGLASIDVAKALMLETTRAKLRERGIDESVLELEAPGIPKALERHGLRFEDLGLRGCTIFYRRRPEDMPLVESCPRAPPTSAVRRSRRRAQEAAREGDREVSASSSSRSRRRTGSSSKAIVWSACASAAPAWKPAGRSRTDETFERRGSYVISSIGSIPEADPRHRHEGRTLRLHRLGPRPTRRHPNVFSAGNVVTGKGNIVASRKHASHVAEKMIESFLGVGDAGHAGEEAILDGAREAARRTRRRRRQARRDAVAARRTRAAALRERVATRQRAVGFADYRSWIERVTPPDLA